MWLSSLCRDFTIELGTNSVKLYDQALKVKEINTAMDMQFQRQRRSMRHKRINFLLLLTIVICLFFLLYLFKAICADNSEEVKLLLYDAFQLDKESFDAKEYRIINILNGFKNGPPDLEVAVKFYITSPSKKVKSKDENGIKNLKSALIGSVVNEDNIKALQRAIGTADVDGDWRDKTWCKLFEYIEGHHGTLFELNKRWFFIINVRKLGIQDKLTKVRVTSAEENELPASDIISALPDKFKRIIRSPGKGKSLTTEIVKKEENIDIERTALATKPDTLSKSITSLKSTIDEKFAQDLPKKIDDIKSEIESLKNKTSGFSPNGGTTSFLTVRLLLGVVIILGVVFLFIILQIFFAFRKHESDSRNNLSRYRDDIIRKVSEQLNQHIPSNINSVLRDLETQSENFRHILDSVGDTSTGNQKIESLLENQKIMMEALNEDINRLDKKTQKLRKTLVIGEKEDPAVMTVLERVEEVRKAVVFLQNRVSTATALSPPEKSDRTVSESAKASSRQRNGPLPKTEEKKDPMKIKFNLDDL